MNIGMFSDTWIPDINGVVNSIVTLEAELEKRGHQVYIFAPSKHLPEEGKNNLFMVRSAPFMFNRQFRIGSTVSRRLAREMKKLNLDIIHTHSEMSLFTFAKSMAKKNNVALVHTYHTMWEEYTHYLPVNPDMAAVRLFVRGFMARCGNSADKIVVPTEKTRRYVVNCCGQENEKIATVPTGIRLDRFRRENWTKEQLDEAREQYGLEGKRVLLFVGRMGEEKRIDVLIDGMARLAPRFPDLRLLVIGYGPMLGPLIEKAKREGIADRVIFTGRKPFEEVGVYYNIADLFVTASLSETQGLTYIEAMAASTPVLARADECVEGLIEDGVNSALFAEDGDFVGKAEYLLSNPGLLSSMGEKARSVSDRYTTEAFADSIINVYEGALDAKRKKEA